MAVACRASIISGVSPLAVLSVVSSSSTSTFFPVRSLPTGYHGLSKSLPASLLASQSTSLFLKSKLVPLSTPNSGATMRSVVSPSADLSPLVGNTAPDFEAEAIFDQEFVKIKLSDFIGKKYVVVFFYPLDFTFVCPTEITSFSDKYSEFEKLNTEVIGVSTDSVFSHLAWIQRDRKSGGLGELKYPLVSDLTKKISKAFHVLVANPKSKEPIVEDIPPVGGISKPVGIALRGLFIIDKEGTIQHATVNNWAIGRNVEETLRTLQALQFVQENPDDVCPVGWKPGEKTMKQDSKLSKEYFATI